MDTRIGMICTIARLLAGCGHVAVGVASPIPGAGALLARHLSGDTMRVTVLGSERNNFFTSGGVELFDLAAQGRIDAFFLGGGEIDGEGNVNLVETVSEEGRTIRWPGSFGSSYMAFMVPRVILFREEHSRRVLVPRVHFVSAPGASDPAVWRRGGPHVLLTGMALFSFDRGARRFALASVHGGHDVDHVRAATGFEFDCPATVPRTEPPSHAELAALESRVLDEVAEVYPRFSTELRLALG